jgi:DNA-binding LytR/AlgR family response regulator
MGKHFALTFQIPQYTTERESRQLAGPSLKLKAWHGIALAIILATTGMYYLVSANSTATAGYTINSAQSQISGALQQQKKLETQLAELQSIQTIQSNPAVTQMVPVTSVNYLQTLPLLTSR